MKQRNTIISAIIILFMLSAGSVMGQWNYNGSNIYYNSGKVGVGLTDPSSDFQVRNLESTGVIFRMDGATSTGDQGTITKIYMKDNTSGDVFVNLLRKRNGNHEFLQSAYSSVHSGWQEFVYFNFATLKYEMRHAGDAEFKNTGDVFFTNSGGVGVKTTSIPNGYALAVNGKIISEEVLVELETSWPDYVFQENYNLPSLDEVDSFMKRSNHLPEVPSAKEVEENGINLGEMNAILLKKIEELYLYTIEQDKRIKALEEKLSE